jgi:hypothetical protein
MIFGNFDAFLFEGFEKVAGGSSHIAEVANKFILALLEEVFSEGIVVTVSVLTDLIAAHDGFLSDLITIWV